MECDRRDRVALFIVTVSIAFLMLWLAATVRSPVVLPSTTTTWPTVPGSTTTTGATVPHATCHGPGYTFAAQVCP